ncbi:MAG TPA: hypothetical protein VKM55_23360 [Candidatus Lokiarchaeia archaeon]|nr:hypothetical protein [Candidatus Lokiarchaeia archaeon]
MTQDKPLNQLSPSIQHQQSNARQGTRIYNAEPDPFDPSVPRLGRRESEPHSAEVTYIYDVLQTNFPGCRAIWDLHHYFAIDNEEIDIQFDVSFFKDWTMPEALSSFKAKDFDNKFPTFVVNILSKSTWKTDLSETVELCRMLKIPIYVVFSPFLVTSMAYRPPFLRLYVLGEDGGYQQVELRKITLVEGGQMDPDAILTPGDILPFRFGLMELSRKHADGHTLYRLILISQDDLRMLPTARDQLQGERDQLQEERDQLKDELEAYKSKFGDILK